MQRSNQQTGILIFFLVISTIHLIGAIAGNVVLSHWTKTLLVPTLLLYFLVSTFRIDSAKSLRNYIVAALVFSFLGDVLLMFVNYKSYFFLMGLGAFLIAHIFYIMTFIMIRKESDQDVAPSYLMLAIAMLYYIGFIGLIYGNLESDFRLPVMVYGVVITTMLVYSYNVRGLISRPFGMLLFLGASLFVISDSLIAVNKFYMALPASGFLIMSTYITAQFLIVQALTAFLKQKNV